MDQTLAMTRALPTDVILEEILPRCEARSLLRFKCACKSFNNFISSNEFISLHLQHSMTCNTNRILILIFERTISCIDLDSPNLPMFSLPLKESLTLVGTCNGLLCMRVQCSFTLINPCTGIYIETLSVQHSTEFIAEFLQQNNCFPIGSMNYGFGYDSLNHDYKGVVILRCIVENPVENNDVADDATINVLFVYSFKANSWRSVMSPSDSWALAKGEENGVLINNHLLHWLFWSPNNNEHRIGCFDLETEQWIQDVPLPDYDGTKAGSHFADILFGTLRDKSNDLVHMGVLDECLCLLTESQTVSAVVDVWVMKEYGVKESWVKLLGVSDLRVTKYMKFCPLAYCSIAKHEVLVRRLNERRNASEFVWYNIRDQRYQRVHQIKTDDQTFKSREVDGFLNACICNGSLVDLPGGQQFLMEQQ